MSTTAIQDRLNAEADAETLALIEKTFAAASDADNILRARFPDCINLDHDKVYAEVFVAGLAGKVSVVVNEELLKAIRRALFGAVREKARKVYTDEFMAKVAKMDKSA